MKRNLLTTRNYGNDAALLSLRIAAGMLMLILHGAGKVQKLGNEDVKFMDFLGMGPDVSLWLVAFAEAICSILIAAGFVFRYALTPLIITMLVVIFNVKAASPLTEIELPLLYLSIYITLFITGPGKYAVDNLLKPGID
jgi:putative oxidoreductase